MERVWKFKFAYEGGNMSEVETLLSPGDASKIDGVKIGPAAITVAARKGQIRIAAQTARGHRLFRKCDIEAFVRKRRAQGKG